MRTAPAVALVTAAALLGDTFLYTVLPVSAARLGLDALAVGLALSLNRWVRLLTNPFAARLYARLPAGALILVALALGVISTAAYALPAMLLVFLAARLVWGMSWSLLRLGTLLSAIEGAMGPHRASAGPGQARTGRALGDARGVYGLGYFGGALYAPFAVESFGWGAAAIGAAVLTLLLGIGPALTVGDWKREVAVDEREEEAVRRSAFDPRFLGLFLVAAVQYGVFSGVIAVGSGLRIADVFADRSAVLAVPVTATVIAGLFALAQRLAQVAWPPLAGRLADRSLPATFALATTVAAVATLALLGARDATIFVALGAVAYFSGITATVAVELAIAHRTTAADRPRILGAYNTWADGGAATGALAAGFLALPGTHLPFVAGAALVAATLVTVPAITPHRLAVGASAR